MSVPAAMKPEPATPRQRRRAIATALVLAAIVLAIYVTVIVQYVSGK